MSEIVQAIKGLRPGLSEAKVVELAAQIESLGCMELLLRRGADPTLVDGAHGGDAMGWAEFHGASEAIQIFQRWMGSWEPIQRAARLGSAS